VTDAKGKQRKRYPYEALMTPYEKLRSLPLAETFLKTAVRFEILDRIAGSMRDNEAADRLTQARRELFNNIHERSWKQA